MLLGTTPKIFTVLFIAAALNIYAQENYIVRSISFEGNKTLTSDNLLEQIEHYQTSWFADVILFEDHYLFSQDIFLRDKERIIRYYQREGFLYAKIDDVSFVKDNESKTVEIKINISEGTPVIVGNVEIKITNNEQQSQIPQIKEKLLLKKENRFRDNLISIDRNMIIKSFINNGFPYVRTRYLLDLDTSNIIVDIVWDVNTGNLSKFGDITFEGNERTERELLINKVSFQTNQNYNSTELDKTQKNIYGLGLFYVVSVNALLNEEKSNLIPITIKLEEAPQFNTKFGVGYGRDEKFRISIDQRWLSFLGGARQLKFYAKHSALELYHFRLNFLQPDFISERTNFSISPYILRQTEPGFTLNNLGADISLQKPLFFDIFGSIKYSFERSNLDTNSVSLVERQKFKIDQIYNKSSIELGFERITSEPFFDPSSGSFSSIAFHYSGLGLQSKYHFLRPSIDYRKYMGVFNWLVFAFRIKVGTIFCYDDDQFVPFEERFYSGGSSSIRGWARAELGPHDIDGKPLGGKSVFETNLEFRYPIYSILSGVTFLDFGNVWQSELTYKIDDFRYASGLGIRVATPIGPVRLDVAIPIFEGIAKVQYFISVGHAF